MNRRLEELEAAAEAEAAEGSDEAENGGHEEGKQASKTHETERQSHNVYNESDIDDAISVNTIPQLRLADSLSEEDEDREEGRMDTEPLSEIFHESHNYEQQSEEVLKNNANIEREEEDTEVDEGIPFGSDGDDEKTTPETFQQLLAAFSAKTAPLLGLHVTKDLCRRLTSIYDKGLAGG